MKDFTGIAAKQWAKLVADRKEKFLKAFIQETKLDPSQITMCHGVDKDNPDVHHTWFEPKHERREYREGQICFITVIHGGEKAAKILSEKFGIPADKIIILDPLGNISFYDPDDVLGKLERFVEAIKKERAGK